MYILYLYDSFFYVFHKNLKCESLDYRNALLTRFLSCARCVSWLRLEFINVLSATFDFLLAGCLMQRSNKNKNLRFNDMWATHVRKTVLKRSRGRLGTGRFLIFSEDRFRRKQRRRQRIRAVPVRYNCSCVMVTAVVRNKVGFPYENCYENRTPFKIRSPGWVRDVPRRKHGEETR